MPATQHPSIKETLEALRREQILDAASRVMAEKGFHRTRMQDVADAAGVSNGTVYNYFASKEELLLALLNRLNETESRPTQLEQIPTKGNPAETIERLMRHRFDLWKSQKDLVRSLLPVILADDELRRRYLNEVIDPTSQLAESALEAGGLGHPRALVRALAASLFGLVILELLEDASDEARSEEAIALLSELFGNAIAKRRGRP